MLQDSVFSIVKTTGLSTSVFSHLQPTEEFADETPLGGVFDDAKYGWLALGPKFCVIDLRTGLKVAAWTFSAAAVNKSKAIVRSVVELPTPLTAHSRQVLISVEYDDESGLICAFHVNGSQILHSMQTDFVVTNLSISDNISDGPLSCFDGVILCGSNKGEVFAIDLNRSILLQALDYISQGNSDEIWSEINPVQVFVLPDNDDIFQQRDAALKNCNHIALLLNKESFFDIHYTLFSPDDTIVLKEKREYVRVTAVLYVPQILSLVVGYNVGAFQIWNLASMQLEFTSQVNVDSLPVTHFGFQEPCDDPRSFCYLWAVYSVIDREEENMFPMAALYSLSYHVKRKLSNTKYIYTELLTCLKSFQMELGCVTGIVEDVTGSRCLACHTYSIPSDDCEDNMLNLCQLVWECWCGDTNTMQYGMLVFDLDQWYKDQMPAQTFLQSNAFLSVTSLDLAQGPTQVLDLKLCINTLMRYSHSTKLEEHFYPNCLQYKCICLTTSEICLIHTAGVQRQIISAINEAGPAILLSPLRIYHQCVTAGLTPLFLRSNAEAEDDEMRCFLLSVALEARLSCFLKRCAHDWATGNHGSPHCTLQLLVDWCWKRAIQLKLNAKELIAPLFTSSSLPDKNICRCLEHCVRQLTQLTSLLDAVLTKCCNLVVPDALSEIEEKFKAIGMVALYFQVVQWFLNVGLLPERQDFDDDNGRLPYPGLNLVEAYQKRRMVLNRLIDSSGDDATNKSCSLLYIDQLIEHEFGGQKIYDMWRKGGSECDGLYPPPSLYSLLRVYLLTDVPDEHKHSLVLYLLVDYSRVYDDDRYETVIARIKQFPTMFGLSNTAIKATQAFWHLDHRNFTFALNQLQCLTGNTLSEWQHQVVLSSLLAQKKSQAALQYLHVRKPAPIQNVNNSIRKVNDQDKLEDWKSCCDLYLARRLVFQALDVVRLCVRNAPSVDDKIDILNFFFKSCRNTGQLSKVLQASLLPFEEEVFIHYLENCDEQQTWDILVMYLLQQARYIEAQQYNNKLRGRYKESYTTKSMESLCTINDRDVVRSELVDVMCSALPVISNKVAHCVVHEMEALPQMTVPKPMSVLVQAKSPKNTFTYKSTFIQDTIENASDTWLNKPLVKRGMKRAWNVEQTPFICTPKLNKSSKSIFSEHRDLDAHTPAKKPKLDTTPKTPRNPPSAVKLHPKIVKEMETLLEMPEVRIPETTLEWKIDKMTDRSVRDVTPHSILKTRRTSRSQFNDSPVDSRYLGESEDEFSDTASKQLRFTIPYSSQGSDTSAGSASTQKLDDIECISLQDSEENYPDVSPPKKMKEERKIYKDNVRGRKSLSLSAQSSSLSEELSITVESIADIPFPLINADYHTDGRATPENTGMERPRSVERCSLSPGDSRANERDVSASRSIVPTGRRSIKGKSGIDRRRLSTPERQDSPTVSLFRRSTRSKTPELSHTSPISSELESIPEMPKQESESSEHPTATLLSATRPRRNRSRTPDRVALPRLEVISESPTSVDVSEVNESPRRRSLRSRSRTPEVEIIESEPTPASPRTLRSRSKTPERDTVILLSPMSTSKQKKSLSRIVLEANALKNNENKPTTDKNITSSVDKTAPSNIIGCTPMKPNKSQTTLLDVSFSPIVNKSVLQSSADSDILMDVDEVQNNSKKTSPARPKLSNTTFGESYFKKSVLQSYESSVADDSKDVEVKLNVVTTENVSKSPITNISESFYDKSILRSYESSVADDSVEVKEAMDADKIVTAEKNTAPEKETNSAANSILGRNLSSLMTSDSEIIDDDTRGKQKNRSELQSAQAIEKEKQTIGEIERELDEIEGITYSDMSDEQVDEEEDDDAVESGEDLEEVRVEEEREEDHEGVMIEEIVEDGVLVEEVEEEQEGVLVEEVEEVQEGVLVEEVGEVQEGVLVEEVEEVQEGVLVEEDEQEEIILVEKLMEEEQDSALLDLEEETEKGESETDDTDEDDKIVSKSTAVIPVNDSDDSSTSCSTNLCIDLNIPLPEESSPESDNITVEYLVEEENMDTNVENQTLAQDPLVDNSTLMGMSIMTDDNSVLQSDNSDNIKLSLSVDSADKQSPQPDTEKSEPTHLMETESKDSSTKIQASDDVVDAVMQNKDQNETKEKGDFEKSKVIDDTEDTKNSPPSLKGSSRGNKTPPRRKLSNSTKSVEATVPESIEDVLETPTPSRRKARTPSSESVPKRMTRRSSREASEPKEELLSTPSRRTRSRAKSINDNESVASDISNVTNDDGEERVLKKGRKTLLARIPETEETVTSKKHVVDDIISEYSQARRLTRHQKSVLEGWMEPNMSGKGDNKPPSKEVLEAELPEEEELHTEKPTKPASRLKRAMSETKAVSKSTPIRRTSVDIAKRRTPERAMVASVSTELLDSPRLRRASFNKAVEALTPKGRRTSVDKRTDSDSVSGSPALSTVTEEEAPSTPIRRIRRASTQSNTSKTEPTRRSKKP